MKRLLTNMTAIGFLVLFLPYTMTFLINGRQGIHKEEALECVRKGQETGSGETDPKIYNGSYSRMYDAVARTQGQVIRIKGAYRELPYHAVSAGRTRDGLLLGEEYSYVMAVECPKDRERRSGSCSICLPAVFIWKIRTMESVSR